MKSSAEMAEIAKALAKAQLEMGSASKSSTNPHFKSKYAALPEVMEVAKVLNKHGLAYVQPTRSENGSVTVETVLIHGESGQWLSGELTLIPQQNTPQGVGSAVTYGRRFSLCSLVGIVADEDDDGEAASRKPAIKQTYTDDTLAEKLQASVQNGRNGTAGPHAVDGRAASSSPATPAGASGGAAPKRDAAGPSGQPQLVGNGQSAGALAHELIAGIDNIKNAVHYGNWKQKHEADANSLPPPLKKAVWAAYDGAAKRFQ